MIGREARLFVCALQFLTRLPTPPTVWAAARRERGGWRS